MELLDVVLFLTFSNFIPQHLNRPAYGIAHSVQQFEEGVPYVAETASKLVANVYLFTIGLYPLSNILECLCHMVKVHVLLEILIFAVLEVLHRHVFEELSRTVPSGIANVVKLFPVLLIFQFLCIPSLLIQEILIQQKNGGQALLAIDDLPYFMLQNTIIIIIAEDGLYFVLVSNGTCNNGLQAIELVLFLIFALICVVIGKAQQIPQQIAHLVLSPAIASLIRRNIEIPPIKQLSYSILINRVVHYLCLH